MTSEMVDLINSSKGQVEHALGLLQNHFYKEVEALTVISKSTLIRAKKTQIA
jgi:hypothetical protein